MEKKDMFTPLQFWFNQVPKLPNQNIDESLKKYIEELILTFISYGTNEKYDSLDNFIEEKIKVIKQDPDKLKNIENIIPVYKFCNVNPVEFDTSYYKKYKDFDLESILQTNDKNNNKSKEIDNIYWISDLGHKLIKDMHIEIGGDIYYPEPKVIIRKDKKNLIGDMYCL